MKTRTLPALAILTCVLAVPAALRAQGTAFTYQGRLQSGANPATGLYDMTFALWTASGGGAQVGPTLTDLNQGVTNGFFTVILDFGAVSQWHALLAEIGVRSNGIVTYTPLSPRQELTPAPYAITAENVDGLVPAAQISGTLLDTRLSPNVALLDHNQTFTGANFFDRGSGGPRLIVQGSSVVDTTPFTGLGFQYYSSQGEGALMSSYDDGYASLSFYTKAGSGRPIAKQMVIDRYGVVGIDQGGNNSGVFNNSATNGAGLAFGTTSGEGIASQRTAGIDQFSLDFYTSFLNRMIIMNNGFVGINTTNPAAQLDVESTGLAINGSHTATTGTTAGVQGTTASTDGDAYAIYGVVSSTSPGGFSAAVRGQNNGTGGSGIGVYGSQGGSGWGGYFTSGSGIGVNVLGGSGTGVSASGGTGVSAYGFFGDGVDGSASSATGIGVSGSHTPRWNHRRGPRHYGIHHQSCQRRLRTRLLHVAWRCFCWRPRRERRHRRVRYWRFRLPRRFRVRRLRHSPQRLGGLWPQFERHWRGSRKHHGHRPLHLQQRVGSDHRRWRHPRFRRKHQLSTTAFIHVASAGSIIGNYTVISNPICDGDPNAILMVTPTLSPHGGSGPYNDHPIGVWYDGSHWTIFEQDNAPFPAGAAFNVLIIKN